MTDAFNAAIAAHTANSGQHRLQCAGAVQPLRVLVVEDDPVQGALLLLALQHCGVHHYASAADGPAALALLASAAPAFDIVMTDLKLPGMDGIEFMRCAAALHDCRFVLVSSIGQDLLESAAKVVRAGGIALLGVLAKPIDLGAVGLLLLRHVQRGQLHGADADGQPEAALAACPHALRQWSGSELSFALDSAQFLPYFQPKIDLRSDMPYGVEVLARWQHPQLGMLGPEHFIARMEEGDLIDRLTEAIYRQALAWARRWREAGIDLVLAVNVSRSTLQRIDTPNRLLQLAREYGIAPQRITVEVTETALAPDAVGVFESITRLRLHGFNVSLDDFGIGYSSLKQLCDMPFTELKIDRAFVTGMPSENKSRPILEAILLLATRLGLGTVAEGIESAAERDFLLSLGCRAGQGYFYSRPMAGEELASWMLNWWAQGLPPGVENLPTAAHIMNNQGDQA